MEAEEFKNKVDKRYCKYCGDELYRKVRWRGELEAPSQFKNRRFCDNGCMRKGRRKPIPDKYCEYCEKKLIPKVYSSGRKEGFSNFIGRRFCDLYCQTKSYRVKFGKKDCLACGKELKRKNGESSVTYRTRKYCDHKCYSVGIMIDNPTDSARYRRLRNSREKHQCIVCGITEKLHNRHIDKNLENDSDNNVVTLCSSCHTRLHALLRKWEKQNVEN